MGTTFISSQILMVPPVSRSEMLSPMRGNWMNTRRPASLFLTNLKKFPVKNSRRGCSVRVSGVSMEEMLSIGKADDDQEKPLGLDDYMEQVRICNRGSERRSEFLPFILENNIIGYVHPTIMELLKQFEDVFTISPENGFNIHNGRFGNEAHFKGFITLHHQLKTPDERTEAVGNVIKWLNKEGVILGVRNELYPVTLAFGTQSLFSLERAAVPYFGTKAYGVHMNGYVDVCGEKSLWVGKRSEMKPTFPGLLDHLVAGGLPNGITCKENLIKECDEEAGIPRAIAKMAVPVGVVSYEDIDENRFKRDVLFCYDLQLPDGFQPENMDGEVEGFMLVPVAQVANTIRKTKLYKPNCALVIIDFLFRHGYITPEQPGYLYLLQSLRRGECL
eukprot:Gb_31783 [translate_table: standard]